MRFGVFLQKAPGAIAADPA